MSPILLVAAGLAVAAFAVLALLRPQVSLVTLVALDVSGLNGVLAAHLGTSPYKPQLALAALALLVLAGRRRLRFAWSPVLLGLMVLSAAFCLSFVDAADPGASWALLNERIRDLFYFLVVYTLLLSTRSLRLACGAAVAVLAGLAGLSVVHEFVLHDVGDLYGLSRVPLVQEGGASTPRHAGTSSDVNFWARLLILFTPLAMSLLVIGRSWRERLIWAGCTASLLVGIYLTQSRGGFIALFVGLLGWLALAGGRYRKAILLLPVALVVVVPLTGIGSRLLTLGSALTGSAVTADPSVATRKRLQLDAWQMFLDRPAFGHGIGSYGSLFGSYDRLSNAYQPVDIVVAAHNFYLEQAADGGVVLLLGWAVFFGTVLFSALRARTISRAARNASARFLAVGILAGSLGWGVASLFLHLSDFRALLLLAALAAALDVGTRQRAVPRPLTGAPPASLDSSRVTVAALVAVSLLAVAGIGEVLIASRPRYVNSATLAVVPASAVVNGSIAYQVDVVSRGRIVPTLTEVLSKSVTMADLRASPAPAPAQQQAATVSVAQSRLGGSITVTVTASDQQAATESGAAAVTRCKAAVAALNSSYQVAGSMTGAKLQQMVSPWVAVPLAGVLVVTLIALGRAVLGRRARRAARLGGTAAQ